MRFTPGPGLTKTQIQPHYNEVRDNYPDGRRLFGDITFADSFEQRFYVLNDGSHILIEDSSETLHGKARLIENGKMNIIFHEKR